MKLKVEICVIRHKETKKIWYAAIVEDIYTRVQPSIDIKTTISDYPYEMDFKENFSGESEHRFLPNQTEYFEKEYIKKEIEIE